jgi:peptide/nickel transport system substrate-binding protein
MSQPDALVEYAFASTAAHVVSKAFVEANGDQYGTPSVGSIGTGPFKFQEWVSGDHQTLVRNDDYWNKANGGPYLDSVVIKILPEPTTRVAGLETGELDYVLNNLPSDQYATVAGFSNVNLSFIPSYYGEWITYNTAVAPFDNKTLRQALAYALDKKGLRQLYYGPDTPDTKATLVYQPLWTFEQPQWQAAWDELPSYDQDLDMARQLLEESGVADQLNGKTIAYYESTPSIKGIGESFIDVMGQLGVTIEAQKITYQEAIALQFGAHDDYDIIVGAWGSDFPDPSGNLRPNFATENIVAGGANASAYSNPQVDELLSQQNGITDKAERARLLIEAQGIIADDAPIIPVTNPGWPLATNKRVQGASVGALWYWGSLFKDLWVTQ